MSDDARPFILIVDDREDIFRFCERCLGQRYVFQHAEDGFAAMDLLHDGPIDAVLVDRDFSHADSRRLFGSPEDVRNEGLHILRWLRRDHPDVPVIMVTGWRDITTAMEAADLGADFLAWDDVLADTGILEGRLQRALESDKASMESVLLRFRELGIVVESPAFARTVLTTFQAIPGNAPILLLGDTGAGKDTLAEAVHALSGDPSRPYVTINVAELASSLAESEMFGHVRGAFTGADRDNLGKIRAAHGGTLFLNEIGDMSLELQAKLLTVLERNEVVPVGGVRGCPANFRLVAASQHNLGRLVDEGRFRRDLLHWLAWHVITIPALCDRLEDLKGLAHSFLRRTTQFRQNKVRGISREAIQYLKLLPWNGNVRQLGSMIEDACAQGARHTLTVADLRETVKRREQLVEYQPGSGPASGALPIVQPVTDRSAAEDIAFADLDYDQATGAYFRYLLRRTNGKMSETAQLAGISKTTAYEWKKRYEKKSAPESKD